MGGATVHGGHIEAGRDGLPSRNRDEITSAKQDLAIEMVGLWATNKQDRLTDAQEDLEHLGELPQDTSLISRCTPLREVGRVEVMAMAESAVGPTGRIFISYRRDETAYPAGWLFDRLAEHFGAAQILKDVDSIELGDDFVQVISRAVGSCDVLLALIGDRWLGITDLQGRRRLDDPDDFVRLEIEAALERNVRIIPILVAGAHMPRGDELPPGLAALTHRHALELSPSRFE